MWIAHNLRLQQAGTEWESRVDDEGQGCGLTAPHLSVHIIFRMRRWLLLFMLIVLPVQYTMANILNCYHFKSAGAAQHVVPPSAAPSTAGTVEAEASDSDAGILATDVMHCECGACHLAGVQPAACVSPTFAVERQHPASHPQDRQALGAVHTIERPNWNRVA